MDPLIIAILCFVLAICLAVADLLVPSGGVLAIASFLAALASIFFAFRSSSLAGQAMLILMLLAIPTFLVVGLRIWPHTPIGRRVILKTPPTAQAPGGNSDLLDSMIGMIGRAENSLMPTGHVRIDHRSYNAQCENGIIEAGQWVEVIAVKQRNLIVVATTKARREKSDQTPAGPELGQSLLDRPAEDLGLDSLDN